MSGSVNKAILIGNVGRDPEVRRTNGGDPVVTFSIATSESWRDKATGERKDRTEWHNVTIFNDNLGKLAEQYVKKGSKVYIEGAIQTREYTDRDGNQRKATEIVLQKFRGALTLLDSRNASRDPDSYGTTTTRDEGSGRGGGASRPMSEIIDDDIPF